MPEQDTNRYTAREIVTSPWSGPPMHAHDWHELVYVLAGEYELSIRDNGRVRHMRAEAGGSFIVPPRVPHTVRNVTAGFSKALVIDQPARIDNAAIISARTEDPEASRRPR